MPVEPGHGVGHVEHHVPQVSGRLGDVPRLSLQPERRVEQADEFVERRAEARAAVEQPVSRRVSEPHGGDGRRRHVVDVDEVADLGAGREDLGIALPHLPGDLQHLARHPALVPLARPVDVGQPQTDAAHAAVGRERRRLPLQGQLRAAVGGHGLGPRAAGGERCRRVAVDVQRRRVDDPAAARGGGLQRGERRIDVDPLQFRLVRDRRVVDGGEVQEGVAGTEPRPVAAVEPLVDHLAVAPGDAAADGHDVPSFADQSLDDPAADETIGTRNDDSHTRTHCDAGRGTFEPARTVV